MTDQGVNSLTKMGANDLNAFLAEVFPQGMHADVTEVTAEGAVCRLPFNETQIRPGGTISGPTMMSLADTAMYAAVLSRIGRVPLAVTTSFNMNFLRKPEPRALIAECRLLKLGKRLAIGDVAIYSEGNMDDMVAHATLTYSVPPR